MTDVQIPIDHNQFLYNELQKTLNKTMKKMKLKDLKQTHKNPLKFKNRMNDQAKKILDDNFAQFIVEDCSCDKVRQPRQKKQGKEEQKEIQEEVVQEEVVQEEVAQDEPVQEEVKVVKKRKEPVKKIPAKSAKPVVKKSTKKNVE